MIKEAVACFLKRQKLMSLSLKAVLFDMDGVLFDSMKYHARAWQETSENRELISSLEDFYIYEGCTGNKTINELYMRTFGRRATEEEVSSIYKEKSDLFSKYNDGEEMEGALSVLKCARFFGLDCIVVTGSGQHSLINKLEDSFPGFFKREKMVTAYDVTQGKPHPEPYLMGLEKAGVSAHEAVVIENAPMGVEAAVAAGIFTIAVNTGPLPNKLLIDAGADLLYPDMTTLANEWLSFMSVAKNYTSSA